MIYVRERYLYICKGEREKNTRVRERSDRVALARHKIQITTVNIVTDG